MTSTDRTASKSKGVKGDSKESGTTVVDAT